VLPGVLAVAAAVTLGRSLRPRFLFHLAGFALLILVAGVFGVCRWMSRWAPPMRRSGTERALKGAAACVMVFASLAILPRAYVLPKQDYEGAMAYVAETAGEGDAVATVGLTVLPYRDYYATDFVAVESLEQLDLLLDEHTTVYVLNTIPIYLESTAPELAARLTDSLETARFRGSLGDGDLVVYRLQTR
jgi:hypothetical protein